MIPTCVYEKQKACMQTVLRRCGCGEERNPEKCWACLCSRMCFLLALSFLVWVWYLEIFKSLPYANTYKYFHMCSSRAGKRDTRTHAHVFLSSICCVTVWSKVSTVTEFRVWIQHYWKLESAPPEPIKLQCFTLNQTLAWDGRLQQVCARSRMHSTDLHYTDLFLL